MHNGIVAGRILAQTAFIPGLLIHQETHNCRTKPSPVLKMRRSQGLEAQNQCPVLENGRWQGLEAQNQWPVLEKGRWQGLGQNAEGG